MKKSGLFNLNAPSSERGTNRLFVTSTSGRAGNLNAPSTTLQGGVAARVNHSGLLKLAAAPVREKKKNFLDDLADEAKGAKVMDEADSKRVGDEV